MLQIMLVVADFHRDGQVVAAVDLGPARQARDKSMDAVLRTELDEIRLIIKRRPRAHEAQITLQDAIKLRHLVEA